ncbi:MAG: hypothetical protein JNK05_20235 [Myxococcales bacterium]|nr:hypothetical protein [Myxococcales bacterium]
MRRRWAWSLVAWVLLFAPSAFAAEIQSYRLDVRPSERNPGAIDVRIEFVYRASTSENKRDGFKYVGSSHPRNVEVVAPDGTRLLHRETYEQRPQEWRIDFDLSEPTQVSQFEETRSAILTFTQDVDWRRSWARDTLSLAWPGQFRVPVRSVEYRVSGGLEPDRLDCATDGDAFLCRTSEPVRLSLTRERSALGSIAGTMVGLSAAALILLLALKSRFAELLATKGVLPPAPAPAYPEPPSLDPQVFRAPPPLPRPADLPGPVLPEGELVQWQKHVRMTVATAAVAPFLTAALVTVFGSGVAPGAMMCIAFAVGALASLWVNKDAQPRVWPGLILGAAVLLPVAAGFVGLMIATVSSGLALGIGKAIADAPPGAGGGSSSCSGGSSCGGGGGGCGGGGCGGGGCGG